MNVEESNPNKSNISFSIEHRQNLKSVKIVEGSPRAALLTKHPELRRRQSVHLIFGKFRLVICICGKLLFVFGDFIIAFWIFGDSMFCAEMRAVKSETL